MSQRLKMEVSREKRSFRFSGRDVCILQRELALPLVCRGGGLILGAGASCTIGHRSGEGSANGKALRNRGIGSAQPREKSRARNLRSGDLKRCFTRKMDIRNISRKDDGRRL